MNQFKAPSLASSVDSFLTIHAGPSGIQGHFPTWCSHSDPTQSDGALLDAASKDLPYCSKTLQAMCCFWDGFCKRASCLALSGARCHIKLTLQSCHGSLMSDRQRGRGRHCPSRILLGQSQSASLHQNTPTPCKHGHFPSQVKLVMETCVCVTLPGNRSYTGREPWRTTVRLLQGRTPLLSRGRSRAAVHKERQLSTIAQCSLSRPDGARAGLFYCLVIDCFPPPASGSIPLWFPQVRVSVFHLRIRVPAPCHWQLVDQRTPAEVSSPVLFFSLMRLIHK